MNRKPPEFLGFDSSDDDEEDDRKLAATSQQKPPPTSTSTLNRGGCGHPGRALLVDITEKKEDQKLAATPQRKRPLTGASANDHDSASKKPRIPPPASVHRNTTARPSASGHLLYDDDGGERKCPAEVDRTNDAATTWKYSGTPAHTNPSSPNTQKKAPQPVRPSTTTSTITPKPLFNIHEKASQPIRPSGTTATSPSKSSRMSKCGTHQRGTSPVHRRVDFGNMTAGGISSQQAIDKLTKVVQQLTAQNARHLESLNSVRQNNVRLQEKLATANARHLKSLKSAQQDNIRLQEQSKQLQQQHQDHAKTVQQLTTQNAEYQQGNDRLKEHNSQLQEKVGQLEQQLQHQSTSQQINQSTVSTERIQKLENEMTLLKRACEDKYTALESEILQLQQNTPTRPRRTMTVVSPSESTKCTRKQTLAASVRSPGFFSTTSPTTEDEDDDDDNNYEQEPPLKKRSYDKKSGHCFNNKYDVIFARAQWNQYYRTQITKAAAADNDKEVAEMIVHLIRSKGGRFYTNESDPPLDDSEALQRVRRAINKARTRGIRNRCPSQFSGDDNDDDDDGTKDNGDDEEESTDDDNDDDEKEMAYTKQSIEDAVCVLTSDDDASDHIVVSEQEKMSLKMYDYHMLRQLRFSEAFSLRNDPSQQRVTFQCRHCQDRFFPYKDGSSICKGFGKLSRHILSCARNIDKSEIVRSFTLLKTLTADRTRGPFSSRVDIFQSILERCRKRIRDHNDAASPVPSESKISVRKETPHQETTSSLESTNDSHRIYKDDLPEYQEEKEEDEEEDDSDDDYEQEPTSANNRISKPPPIQCKHLHPKSTKRSIEDAIHILEQNNNDSSSDHILVVSEKEKTSLKIFDFYILQQLQFSVDISVWREPNQPQVAFQCRHCQKRTWYFIDGTRMCKGFSRIAKHMMECIENMDVVESFLQLKTWEGDQKRGTKTAILGSILERCRKQITSEQRYNQQLNSCIDSRTPEAARKDLGEEFSDSTDGSKSRRLVLEQPEAAPLAPTVCHLPEEKIVELPDSELGVSIHGTSKALVFKVKDDSPMLGKLAPGMIIDSIIHPDGTIYANLTTGEVYRVLSATNGLKGRKMVLKAPDGTSMA